MRTHSYGNQPSRGVKQSDLVEIPVQATLERILQNDAFLRKTILALSDLFKSGSLHGADPPDTLRDITDGSEAREHPHLLRRATADEDEADDVLVGLMLYYDDVEVCNPLGFAKGSHAIGAFYYAIIFWRMAFACKSLMMRISAPRRRSGSRPT
jgi:hypothetical protein